MMSPDDKIKINSENVALPALYEEIEFTALNFVQADRDKYIIESGYTEGGKFSKRGESPPIPFYDGLTLGGVAELQSRLVRDYTDVFVNGELYREATRRKSSLSEV